MQIRLNMNQANTLTPMSGELTDEQCDEFRRTPGSFNNMVREIFKAGYNKSEKDTMNILLDLTHRFNETQRLRKKYG